MSLSEPLADTVCIPNPLTRNSRLQWRALVVSGLPERVAEPLETLVETITRCSTGRLDILQQKLARIVARTLDLLTQALCRRE